MGYELYTVPKCDGCGDVRKFLDEKAIAYDVLNLRDEDGQRRYGKIFLQVNDKVRKNYQNKTILPLLIGKTDGKVEQIAQEIDEIRNLFC